MSGTLRTRILGSLVAGAAGDALGYTIEFLSLNEIIISFGKKGISEFHLDESGVALISDDTQMTAFTAVGLIDGLRAGCGGSTLGLVDHVKEAYLDWFRLQSGVNPSEVKCWLSDVPGMRDRRAPGNTCISSLKALSHGTIPTKISCGCGGVMRVAPVALVGAAVNARARYAQWRIDDIVALGIAVSNMTHKSPVADLAAGMMTYLLYSIATSAETVTAKDIERFIGEAKALLARMINQATGEAYEKSNEKHLESFFSLVNKGIALAKTRKSAVDAITEIGEGWHGDEAFVIALYCALKYTNNVEAALIASVNHGGDSDSTGSITGNIVGLIMGYDKIPEKFKKNLETLSTIEKIANDIYYV